MGISIKQSIKLYLGSLPRIELAALIAMPLIFLVVVLITFNVPISRDDPVLATIVSIGTMQPSRVKLAYPIATANLGNGTIINVEIPTTYVVLKGDQVYVTKVHLLLGGAKFNYHSKLVSP